MANILDRYGIKEVADVVFYKISPSGKPESPVLYLDTLKVSTIEQTAEEAEARGGKGNAALIAWDYGKEITVTLEDALFSAKSMAIMFGNGSVKEFTSTDTEDLIMKTIQVVIKDGKIASGLVGEKVDDLKWEGPGGNMYPVINPLFFSADEKEKTKTIPTEDGTYFCTFDLKASGAIIDVSANSFPGTYYVVGDTFARSEASGEDEMFQFIIPKAKVTSENTITLEAEGDPSVFNMNLKVLRPADGKMMRLVKYTLDNGTPANNEIAGLVHNHDVDAASTEQAQG